MIDNLVAMRELLDGMQADDPAILKIPEVVDHMTSPLVYAQDTGVIAFANIEACRFFGYDLSEIRNQPLAMLIPERFRAQHSEAFRRRCESDRLRPSGMPAPSITLDAMALLKSGEEIPITIYLSSRRHNGSITFSASFRRRDADGC